jgi:hypothetical protein
MWGPEAGPVFVTPDFATTTAVCAWAGRSGCPPARPSLGSDKQAPSYPITPMLHPVGTVTQRLGGVGEPPQLGVAAHDAEG